jgi:hypothetical protein
MTQVQTRSINLGSLIVLPESALCSLTVPPLPICIHSGFSTSKLQKPQESAEHTTSSFQCLRHVADWALSNVRVLGMNKNGSTRRKVFSSLQFSEFHAAEASV